ncbi:MAG: radical SAM protein [Acidobacteriota bacterium]|nr:radical SAM protein [Acidobacteriota bacterium]
MRVLLVSTYELGHQPLHVAAPAGGLRRHGHEVRGLDLAVDPLEPALVQWAEAVAISVPMHTAMRLARRATAAVRALAPRVPVCFYGLYAGTDGGADDAGTPDLAITGEYLEPLASWVDALAAGKAGGSPGTVRVELGRHPTGVPARGLLPPLERYAELVVAGARRPVGYVEASRGCAHRCRHCPVPVVYDGRTRLVGVEDVLADVAQLVGMGARHLTYGDPDFLNGPHHARRVVQAVHGAFPELTFDVTAKVTHVLAHGELWPELAAAGCLFVVSAFESATDSVLDRLDKGHRAADEAEAVRLLRGAGIEPRPSLLPFTPWTSPADVWDLLGLLERCDLVGNVDPVHYSIRLLVPPGSLLLDGGHLEGRLGVYDPELLGWQWRSSDPRLDVLQQGLALLAEEAGAGQWGAAAVHEAVRAATGEVLGDTRPVVATDPDLRSPLPPDARPRLSEPWFCCAEPTTGQFESVAPEPALSPGAR